MPTGQFHPTVIARSYRDLNPGKFDDIDDSTLIDALKDIDPDTYQLIDPQLIGAELLPEVEPPKPQGPLAVYHPPPSTAERVITTVPRVGGMLGGAALGGAVGAPTIGGMAGGGAGEVAAEGIEKYLGSRESFSPTEIGLQTAFGAYQPIPVGAAGPVARTAVRVSEGAMLGTAGDLAEQFITNPNAPPEFRPAPALTGAAFGGAMHLGGEAFGAVREAAPSFRPEDMGLPTGAAAPNLMAQEARVAQVQADMRRVEAQEISKDFAKRGWEIPPSQRGTLAYGQQAKAYLDTIADLMGVPPEMPGGGAPPMMPPVGPVPPATTPQKLLPPSPILAYGPEGPPPSDFVVPGTPGRGVQAQPTLDRLGEQLESSLYSGPEGPPRLSPEKQIQLTGEVPGPPIAAAPPLLPGGTPPKRPQSRIEKGATPDQPYLPEATRPSPLDRQYATGPNAGPRRERELHGQPRTVGRRVDIPGTDKYRMETVPTTRMAEDPGTYPADVRREMARMLYEMVEHPHERIGGGITGSQIEDLIRSNAARDASEAIAYLKESGVTSGGAIPGAPVFRNILDAAEGARAHATRGEVIRDLRAALLEGKGSHLSDAAAEVARQRMAQEERGGLTPEGYKAGSFQTSRGNQIRGYPMISQKGAGDDLIGWIDEAGNKVLPDQDLSPEQQMVREDSDGDLLQIYRVFTKEGVPEGLEVHHRAITDELVRRGLIRPEQMDLTMEGPGGAKGPSLFDFEGDSLSTKVRQLGQRIIDIATFKGTRETTARRARARVINKQIDAEGIEPASPEWFARVEELTGGPLDERVEQYVNELKAAMQDVNRQMRAAMTGEEPPQKPEPRKAEGWGDLATPNIEEDLGIHERRRDQQAKEDAYREVMGIPPDQPLTEFQKFEAVLGPIERVPDAFAEGAPPVKPAATKPIESQKVMLPEQQARQDQFEQDIIDRYGEDMSQWPEHLREKGTYKEQGPIHWGTPPELPPEATSRRPTEKPYENDVLHVTTPAAADAILKGGFNVNQGGGLGGDTYGPGVYLADYQRDMGSFWAQQLETKNLEGTVDTTGLRGRVRLTRPFQYEYNIYSNATGDIKGRITPRQSLERQRPDLVPVYDAVRAAQGQTDRRAFGQVLREAGYDGLVIEHRQGDEIVAFNAKDVRFTHRGGKPIQGEAQPTLPGTEAVRETEIPTPPVAEAPFALTPPPAKPEFGSKESAQRSLFDRLKDDVGAIAIPRKLAGDRVGFKKWLADQEQEHGEELWFNRAEEALAAGDHDRAWKIASAAAVRSFAKASAAASTPQEEEALRRAVKGTVLQADLPTQIVAAGRRGQIRRPAPTVTDLPPSPRIGMQETTASLGPAGIMQVGPPQKRTPTGVRAMTLDKEIVSSFLDELEEKPELVHLIRGNRDAALRLATQLSDLIAQGHIPFDYRLFPGMSRYEVGRQYRQTLGEAGRILQTHSAFVQQFDTELHEMQDRFDIGAALGRPGGLNESPPIKGARGRPLTAEADAALQRVANDLNLVPADRTALLNDLQERHPQSLGQALVNSQYAFLTSPLPTATRNAIGFGQRYGVEVLDDLMTAGAGRFLGGKERAVGVEAGARAAERVTALTSGRAGVVPSPKWVKRGLAEAYEDIYGLTTDVLLNGAPKNDVKQVMRVIQSYPAQAAHMIGAVLGEEVPIEASKSGILNIIGSPRVQRYLQIWNRAQEFPTRALAADTNFRGQLRAKGFNPAEVLANPDLSVMAERVGGRAVLERMIERAVADGREMTYAGGFAKNSIPGWMVHMIQEAWVAKLGVRFPAFNFARAPRWIYDHGPWALADLVRLPFDRAGWTSTGKHLGGGRLYRGLQAHAYETDVIPALRNQITEQEGRVGDAINDLQATSREWNVRNRQIARLERKAQAGLPDIQTSLDQAIEMRGQLARRRDRALETRFNASRTIADLEKQEKVLWGKVQNATGISAPTYASWIGRMAGGTLSMLGAAVVMRSSKYAEGTRYDQLKFPRGPDENGKPQDPWNLDFSAFAPTPQFMYVADVMVDFERHTDWAKVLEDVKGEFSPPTLAASVGLGATIGSQAGPGGAAAGAVLGGSTEEILKWNRAIWSHYTGKYTPETLGADFGRAFLSMSRLAGTSLTLADLMTRNGWPGLQDVADAAVGTIGQFLAGYAAPLGQFKDLAGAVSPEEATVRDVPRTSTNDPASWSYPLLQPLARIPIADQLLPPVISQTTGQPLRNEHPATRVLTGIGGAASDFIQDEIRRVGVPGSSVYIRETGDNALDQLLATTYGRILQRRFPRELERPYYRRLGTPADQRDYLQRVAFPAFKREAVGRVKQVMGYERVEASTVRGEAARRKQRRLDLLDRLQGELGPAPPDDTEGGGPPPGPPQLTPPAGFGQPPAGP